MTGIIGTWEMSAQGVEKGMALLSGGASAGDAVETAIRDVEENPAFSSVGYGGLPAMDGQVYLDAGWMDGNSLRCGAVVSAREILHPVTLARGLCGRETNWMLAGEGAEAEARQRGLAMRDMRTPEAVEKWKEMLHRQCAGMGDRVYRGHDTVCVIARDAKGRMVVGTSTSGLFMKQPGRVGDTPVVGSGFYCDASVGAAAATGLGEDIMRGVLSFACVQYMRSGLSPMEACRSVIRTLQETKDRLGEGQGSFSVIAMDAQGCFGAATSETDFPYVIGQNGSIQVCHAAWDRQ